VLGVRKFVNGDIEVDFYREVVQYRYSSDSSRLSNFPKDPTESLALTLGTDICIKIFFGDDGNTIPIELEECDDDLDDEIDDDLIRNES